MIKVKHPSEEKNKEQEKYLALLKGETKEFFAIMFSHGNASYHYYNQDINPTFEDYQEWLTGLTETIRANMAKLGFDGCRNILSLKRYAIEKSDIGMEEFVKNLMGDEDYNNYLSLAER